MSVIIGVDPHKSTRTAVAIDRDERPLARLRRVAERGQTGRLLAWVEPLGTQRTWAVESAGGLGKLLARQLLEAGEHVVDVPRPCGEAAAAGFGQGVQERPQRRVGPRHRRVGALRAAGGAGGGPQRGHPDADRSLRRSGGLAYPGGLSAACGAARAHRRRQSAPTYRSRTRTATRSTPTRLMMMVQSASGTVRSQKTTRTPNASQPSTRLTQSSPHQNPAVGHSYREQLFHFVSALTSSR
jgi:hypothetical protein